MREPRNPFRLRAAEAIESDITFLKLFGPGMLDLLPGEARLWDKPLIFRSAPGGGKTSLFRLFTPSVLVSLHAFRRNDELKDLYERMREMEVVEESGPRLLGVLHSCAQNYATLEEGEKANLRCERIVRWAQRLLKRHPYVQGVHRVSRDDKPDLRPTGILDISNISRHIKASPGLALERIIPAVLDESYCIPSGTTVLRINIVLPEKTTLRQRGRMMHWCCLGV